MSLFKKKSLPGSQLLPEPRLEAAAVELAITQANAHMGAAGDAVALSEYLSAVFDEMHTRLDEAAKTSEERAMIEQRASYLKEQMTAGLLERRFLYVRFDIAKVDSGGYGGACYRILFRAIPLRRLLGVTLYEGDSAATLNGREDVFVIGLYAPEPQLELIRQSMSKSVEFKAVCAKDPLQLKNENLRTRTEPLVEDGVMRIDGVARRDEQSAYWAKSAYDALKSSGEI